MKKFLTVLLVIAVMFTFSFGSAFAAVPNYDKNVAGVYFENAMKAVKEAGSVTVEVGGSAYTVAYATLNAHSAELLDAVLDYEKNNDAATDYVQNVAGIEAVLDSGDYDVTMTLVAEQYESDKAGAISILEGLDTSEFSSKAMPAKVDGCTTYVEHVKYIIAEAVKEINAATFNSDSTVKDYADAKAVIDKHFDAYDAPAPVATAIAAEKGYEGADNSYIGLGIYEVNSAYAVNDTTTLAKYKTDYVDAMGATSEAQTAAVKAQIAADYATYVALHSTAADKTYAANVKKVLDYLADEGVALGTVANYFKDDKSNGDAVAKAISDVEVFEGKAARYAAETDANGALVRDAEDVADYITEGTVNAYAKALNVAVTGYDNTDTCLTKIYNLYLNLDAEKLAFAKKVRETLVADMLDGFEANGTYYPVEAAKVKALADEYVAKVNAVTAIDKLEAVDTDYLGDKVSEYGTEDWELAGKIGAVLEGKEVIEKFAAQANSLKDAAQKYAELMNSQISKKANKYFTNDGGYEKLNAEVEALIGNSEARTAKDVNALAEQAIGLVKTLPTNAAVDAAKEAADDAVAALPSKVTIADKALIDAANAAADAYDDLTALKYDRTAIDTAATKLAYAFNNEIAPRVKAVSATDKAAVQALIDEIDAFVGDYGNEAAFTNAKNTLNGYLAQIQKDAAKKVDAAITAIPVAANLTEASKAVVEAAKAAYDAYVEEYTDYADYDYDYTQTVKTDGFVADDFAYVTLANAATALGLNTPDKALSVEALKITARSTAKKGSITVKWTVKGDTAAVEGWEIWKSTKKNSGYKKAFTQKAAKKTYKNTKGLKKGTRYYYKVRAIAYTADGTKVKSDWSNKAYRIAK